MGSCKISLEIPLTEVNNKMKDLVESNEIAGVLVVSGNKVTNLSKNIGSSDSVYTPNHVINYHTHPVNAYNNADTVWGWPSGEDIRETMKFCLGGNKAHIVFTVEGLYTIQLSPCKIKKLKELTDIERGVIIFIIEEYFKCTHNFRCVTEVNKLNKQGIVINPYSYVNLVKNFELKNIISSGIKTYSKTDNNSFNGNEFPNIGFLEYEYGKIKTTGLNNFLNDTIDLSEFEELDQNGKNNNNNKITKEEFKKTLKRLFVIFNSRKCTKLWNNKPNLWFHINFFPSRYYSTGGYYNQERFVTPVLNNLQIGNLLQIDEIPFIKIYSEKSSGCSINEIAKINKFRYGTDNVNNFGKRVKIPVGKLNRVHYDLIIHHLTKNKSIKTLDSLIKIINKYIKVNELNIPLVNKKMLISLL